MAVTKPIPMKRELKVAIYQAGTSGGLKVTKPIPMKRELKVRPGQAKTITALLEVTKPIPMKRELKDSTSMIGDSIASGSHKANPDEKGTESNRLPLG